MISLELLAPARNKAIGIAAIDCGADAVYIAGPSFGARKDAGNSVEDIAQLCQYAHRFGARVFATVNTLVYDAELPVVEELIFSLQEAGVDALIVQDMSLLSFAQSSRKRCLTLPLHASTQCAIRTPQRARDLVEAGFSRLILERQLSLQEINEIRQAVPSAVELECFVHGALCVSYSGQCYLSEALCGRSANRGACVQACRSRYNVYDEKGNELVHDKAVLSLKDLKLLAHIGALLSAGVTSFKIEGRLKNESYVRNVVAAYSHALDDCIAREPARYCRASYGRSEPHFNPDVQRTFHRSYTSLYLQGQKGDWAAMEIPKGMGAYVGDLSEWGKDYILVKHNSQMPAPSFSAGDGLSFVALNGDVEGFRVEAVREGKLICRPPKGLYKGVRLYRNLDFAFEKQLASAQSQRLLSASLSLNCRLQSEAENRWLLCASAQSEDGRKACWQQVVEAPVAQNQERMQALVEAQLSKKTDLFQCHYLANSCEWPLLSASVLNGIRRELCEAMASTPCHRRPLYKAPFVGKVALRDLSYKSNIANSKAVEMSCVAEPCCPTGPHATDWIQAFELKHPAHAEWMRSRYCLRHELGLCPRQGVRGKASPLYLENNGRRIRLEFDCARCEMVVTH